MPTALLSMRQIAELAQVPINTAAAWRKRPAPGFPEPSTYVQSGGPTRRSPRWSKAKIETWLRNTGRHPDHPGVRAEKGQGDPAVARRVAAHRARKKAAAEG